MILPKRNIYALNSNTSKIDPCGNPEHILISTELTLPIETSIQLSFLESL